MGLPPTETTRKHAPKPSLRGYRILVVEDSWVLAQSLKSILEVVGMTVVGPAATLDDAAALADSTGFDVALMDLDLQGRMSDALITDMHRRGLPVIIVTAHEVPPDLAANAAAVLPKPVRAEALLTCLRRIRADGRAPR